MNGTASEPVGWGASTAEAWKATMPPNKVKEARVAAVVVSSSEG
jgi:hypothetical protein